MANNGALSILNPSWQTIKVAQFGQYYRLIFDGAKIDITLTFSKSDPSHVNQNMVFIPTSYNAFDYFLRI